MIDRVQKQESTTRERSSPPRADVDVRSACGSTTVSVTTTGRRPIPEHSGPGHRRGEGSFVTDIIDPAVSTSGGSARGAAISALRLPELQAMASELGVKGTSKMRKGDLVQAISDARGSSRPQALEPRRSESVAVAEPPARAARTRRTQTPQLDLDVPAQVDRPQTERSTRAAPKDDALAGLEAALDAKLAPVDDRAARAADAVGTVTGERRSRRSGRGAGAPQGGDDAAVQNPQQNASRTPAPAGATASRTASRATASRRQARQQGSPPAGREPAGRQPAGPAARPAASRSPGRRGRRGARRSSSALARPLPRP